MGRKPKAKSVPSTDFNDDKIISTPIDENQLYRGDKNVPKENAQFEWTKAMVDEVEKCKDDVIHFAQSHFTIVNLNKGLKEKIELYPAQKQILRSLLANRFCVVLASRQTGKSTLMVIYALWIACFRGDERVVIVANKEETAIKIFKKVRIAYELLPLYLKPGVKEYGKTGVTFDNDSSIGVSTTTSSAIRGDSVSALIIDEMAFIECVSDKSTVEIRNKKTGEIKKVTISNFIDIIEKDVGTI